MYTFSQLGNFGRLGNQLFQYAALKSLGLQRDIEIKIPDPKQKHWHGQDGLLQNFNINCSFLNESDYKKIKYKYFEPDHMKFDNDFKNIPDNTDLYGFFQSILYFDNYQDIIKFELTPKEIFLSSAEEKLKKIKEKFSGFEIVSIHLRRGDNTDNSNPNKKLNSMYGNNIIDFKESFYGKYFFKAKELFKDKKVKFLVFSGGSRETNNPNLSDIEWCKQNLLGDEYIFSESNDTMSDFCNIMLSDHNIISHVSSFGWWAAFVNDKNKTVVAPKHYHPDMPDYTYRSGFYPTTWRII